MAEHPNVALVREAFARLESEGPEAIAAFVDEDVVWHEIGRAEPRHGLAEVAASLSGYDVDFEIHDILASDDHVVVLFDAIGKRDGRTFPYQVAEIYHFKDGKVTERWAFAGDTEAIATFFA